MEVMDVTQMTVIRIAQTGEQGITQRQAIEIANQRRVNLLSNKQLDERLLKTGTWLSDDMVYPAWTGTIVAYEAPEKKLASIIRYVDPETKITYALEVPVKATGASDVVLVVNHMVDAQGKPLITYEDKGKNNVLVKIHDPSKINIIENFPRSDSWHLTDPEFDIPTGKVVHSSNPDARYLLRTDSGAYVGLAARFCIHYGDYRRGVYLSQPPYNSFGVLAEEPANAGEASGDAKV